MLGSGNVRSGVSGRRALGAEGSRCIRLDVVGAVGVGSDSEARRALDLVQQVCEPVIFDQWLSLPRRLPNSA